jgi:hypothetical protein
VDFIEQVQQISNGDIDHLKEEITDFELCWRIYGEINSISKENIPYIEKELAIYMILSLMIPLAKTAFEFVMLGSAIYIHHCENMCIGKRYQDTAERILKNKEVA